MKRRSAARRRSAAVGSLLACGLWQASAMAQEAPQNPHENATFLYTEPMPTHYLRPMVEELAALLAGLGQYYWAQETNSLDWDNTYDWAGLESKIDGSGYAFDTNYFDTNYLSHPGSGTIYYWLARGNRMSVMTALAFAFASSAVWEYAGEFRERVSVNDVFVTPLAGLAIGETTTQIGAFFDRSCGTVVNRTLGAVFAPSKTAHDLADGAELARTSECDRYGLARSGEHRFALRSAGAAVFSEDRPSVFETRLGLDLGVKNLRRVGHAGRGLDTFDDGNVAELSASAALSKGGFSDVRVAVRNVPAGIHFRDSAQGTRRREVIFGPVVRGTYSAHRFDRERSTFDRAFFLDAPAVTVEYVEETQGIRFDARLDAGGSFGGVSSPAQARYLRYGSADALPSVAREHGYNHVVGLVLAPSLRLRTPHVELGAALDSHRVWAVRFLDRYGGRDFVPASDGVRRGAVWVGFGPRELPPRLVFFADFLEHRSTVEVQTETRREYSTGLALESVL
jgi:hypothetical protein